MSNFNWVIQYNELLTYLRKSYPEYTHLDEIDLLTTIETKWLKFIQDVPREEWTEKETQNIEKFLPSLQEYLT